MKLFFDTETTGIADFKSAPDAKHQPRIVQLSAILTDNDGQQVSSLNLIIKPSGFVIPPESSALHGITSEIANQSGIPLFHALMAFVCLARCADRYCCHNSDFDVLMIKGECARALVAFPDRPSFCTMKNMTDICKLPGPYGFKWPKLQEAYVHAFGKEFNGAHDALADVNACREIYFWLAKLETAQ